LFQSYLQKNSNYYG